MCQPHIVVHECTSHFAQWLFKEYLPEYDMHQFVAPENSVEKETLGASTSGFQSGSWLLSPTQFGWPCFRPRPACSFF